MPMWLLITLGAIAQIMVVALAFYFMRTRPRRERTKRAIEDRREKKGLPDQDEAETDDIVGEDVKVHDWFYFTVLFILYVLPLEFALLTALGLTGARPGPAYAVAGLSLLHLAASVRFVKPDRISAIEIFTIPAFETSFQVVVSPLGLAVLTRMPRGIQQRDVPGSPERVYREDDKKYTKERKLEGFVLPMRITTGPASKDEQDRLSPLNRQLTLEFIITPRWRIVNPFQFVVNIGSIEEVWKQMMDRSQTFLTNACSSRSAAGVYRELEKIKDELQDTLQQAVESWGIKIISLDFKSPDPSHTLNRALRDVSMAEARAQEVRVAADAAAYQTVQAGQADATAAAVGITARGTATKQAADESGLTPAQILAGDIAREVIKPTDKVILGADGLAQAVASGTALVNAMNAPRPTMPPAPSPAPSQAAA